MGVFARSSGHRRQGSVRAALLQRPGVSARTGALGQTTLAPAERGLVPFAAFFPGFCCAAAAGAATTVTKGAALSAAVAAYTAPRGVFYYK